MDNGLSANADKWPIPHDLTIDEINGLLQQLSSIPKPLMDLIRVMLANMLNDNFTIICMNRNLDDEGSRLRMISALAKIDLLILLTRESLGMVETLQNRLVELTGESH